MIILLFMQPGWQLLKSVFLGLITSLTDLLNLLDIFELTMKLSCQSRSVSLNELIF